MATVSIEIHLRMGDGEGEGVWLGADVSDAAGLAELERDFSHMCDVLRGNTKTIPRSDKWGNASRDTLAPFAGALAPKIKRRWFGREVVTENGDGYER